MTRFIVLDSGPLGLLTSSRRGDMSDDCTQWLEHLAMEGAQIVLPEITDYELRRELIRIGARKSVIKLDSLVLAPSVRYLPIDTKCMRLAAQLWADVRRDGKPTAHQHALDADVILAAQALGLDEPEVVVATTNVAHLSRFVGALPWQEVTPYPLSAVGCRPSAVGPQLTPDSRDKNPSPKC